MIMPSVQSNGMETSEFFNISEGVRQGEILSADLYKVYVNPLLERLNRVGVGARIARVTLHYACADDVTLNTTDFNDAQVLLTIAEDFLLHRKGTNFSPQKPIPYRFNSSNENNQIKSNKVYK